MNNYKKIKVHIVANNHIDREWTYDSQLTRMITVNFFEDLIETFEKIPDFQFVLDSQTVPLEDFLEICPDKKEILKKYVEEKRLWIGPWYTAPDCFYLNGESVVRNLLVGHEVAATFGNVSKFGYTPFGWGQLSQLPQIYAGFGIDSLFFYRGADTINANYYRWVGADGTAAYCIKYHRTNFFDKVFRPMTKNREAVPWDRELNYFGNEIPFMFSTDEYKYEHGFVIDGKYNINEDKIEKAVDDFVENETNNFPGGIILGMNGMDTCFPSLKGLLAIDKIKNEKEHDYELIYSSLDQFSDELKEAAARSGFEMQSHSGEMRRFLPGFGGPGKSEVKSTHFYLASTRPRQKSKNAKAENMLARYSEPFATVSHILGKPYPVEYFNTAWKHLLKCHSHDTIAGCGVDQIEKDMLNRLDQSINISKAALNLSFQHIILNIDNSQVKDDELVLVVFNPSPFVRKDIVALWLHIPEKSGFKDFEIVEKTNEKVLKFNIIERGEMTDRIFRDFTDTSLYTFGELVKINLEVEVDGLGYKSLLVRKSSFKLSDDPMMGNDKNQMENDHLKVTINEDGTFNIVEKTNSKEYDNLHYFTDTGDNGDPWVRFVPDKNRLCKSRTSKAKISLIENSSLSAKYEIEYHMMIPEGLNKSNYIMEGYYDYAESSEKLVPLKIKSIVTLTKDARYLDIKTEIDNQSTDHLVQVVFPTGLKADKVYAESGFDVVERSIVKNEKGIDPSLVNGEDPFLKFVDMSEANDGLAILSDSVKGYEVLGDKENSIALNLIRSYTSQIVTIYGRKERRPDQNLTQAKGIHVFHYAIYPHVGTWEEGCFEQAEKVNFPLLPTQTHRSFGALPSELSFIKLAAGKIVISALKKSNRDDAVILRLYNPSTKTVYDEIEFFKEILDVESVNLNEEPMTSHELVNFNCNRLRLSIGAKKICSYKLIFKI
jgi:mannosylglycerate hydrolase